MHFINNVLKVDPIIESGASDAKSNKIIKLLDAAVPIELFHLAIKMASLCLSL